MSRIEPLQHAGTYEILTPLEFLRIMPQIIERAGRTSYQSYRDREITAESAEKFCRMLIERGHESVLEHSSMTVRFDGCSRGFTHELVRHRLASPTQESTRYVDYRLDEGKVAVVVPPGLDAVGFDSFTRDLQAALDAYSRTRDRGMRSNSARQLLPIAIKSEIVVTANFREWRHIFSLRCDRPAHWEIREVMCRLLVELQSTLPGVFDDFVYGGQCGDGIDWYARLLSDTLFNRQVKLRKLRDQATRGSHEG